MPPRDSPLSGNLRLISVGAAALIVAVAAYLLIDGGSGSDDSGSGPPPAAASVKTAPAVVDSGDLRALSAELGHPLYWAGPRPGTELELSREGNGDIYVRYLTGGAQAGDPRPNFLTVGTYPVPDAAGAVRRAASQAGSEPLDVAHGGTGFVDPDSPGSVYMAYPGADYQIEVFTPASGEALRLVEAGKIVPVG